MASKFRRFIVSILLLIAVAVLLGAVYITHLLQTPYKGYSEPKVAVTINRGMSLNSIVETLHQKGIIQNPWLLKGIFMWKRTAGQSKAGDYVFDRQLTLIDVYEKLLKGEMSYTVVTIPEGTSIFDMPVLLQDKQLISSPEQLQNILRSSTVLKELKSIDPEIESAEGFLFPETYFLGKTDSAEKMVVLMIRQFKKQYGEQERRQARDLNMTTLQVVTLASLIEKETGKKPERPLISGVFHNRLKKSMLLQCDPTVIYALRLTDTYRGSLTYDDLKRESPYNTYVSPGLPPSPICNPGKASIQAALYPVGTDKLYFVSKNDGSHHFSATLAEHNRAVQQYQRH